MVKSEERWHLSKAVDAGHIITTVLIVISIFTYIGSFDKRLAEAELKIVHLKEAQVAQIARSDAKFRELKVDLKEINSKLDRIIERGSR